MPFAGDLSAVSDAPILEVRGWALCWERVRYSRLKEAAFVRGGRYGISIDFGLEVVGRKSSCGATVNLELISFPMMPRLPMASSYRETHHSSRPTATLLLVSDLPCRWLRARASVRRKAASFKPTSRNSFHFIFGAGFHVIQDLGSCPEWPE